MKEKILIADDEKELARAIGMILKYSNYEVDIVENGKQAVEKTIDNVYDVIILDVMMPIMDGIQALKEMRRNNIKTPILLLTRINEEKKEKYKIGNIVFNKENAELSSEKASLHLNNKECEMMEFLIKNQKRAIDKKELRKRIWTKENSDENIVTMYISYLQDKFLALGANIKINDKNGYMLEKIL